MSPKAKNYVSLSEHYWHDAQTLLAKKDWPQASEKMWGSVAELVKAVAENRGWKHDGHASLFGIVGKLAKEAERRELVELFHLANSLHINFYENWFPGEQVAQLAEKLTGLRKGLQRFLK